MPLSDLHALRGKLIVSVQADEDEPLAPPDILAALCDSVLSGGAAGLRLANPEVMRRMRRAHPGLPIIGITKPKRLPTNPTAAVYITPTVADALAVLGAGATIVATDATDRPRPDGASLADWVRGYAPATRKP